MTQIFTKPDTSYLDWHARPWVASCRRPSAVRTYTLVQHLPPLHSLPVALTTTTGGQNNTSSPCSSSTARAQTESQDVVVKDTPSPPPPPREPAQGDRYLTPHLMLLVGKVTIDATLSISRADPDWDAGCLSRHSLSTLTTSGSSSPF